jgi:epimerase EvaD
MKIIPVGIGGAYVVELDRYTDNRGWFEEAFNDAKFPEEIKLCKQISISSSHKNVFRGIHTSRYSKVVTCLRGRILDVCFDLIEGSPTYLQWKAIELSGDVPSQLYIPPGCGHAFICLEDDSLVMYAQGGTFNPNDEMDVNYKDPQINFNVPQLQNPDLVISEKDQKSAFLVDARAAWYSRHPDVAPPSL